MTFALQLLSDATVLYECPVPTPYIAQNRVAQFDDFQPRRLTGISVAWTLHGVLYGTSTTLPTLWSALKAAISNPSALPNGIQLKSGATVVESIKASDGYILFAVESLESPVSPDQWVKELVFSIKVTAVKRFPIILVGALNVSNLKETKTWAYDASGLSRVTLQGEVEVLTGSSATAAARLLVSTKSLGLGLSLPGPTFAFETNGPEGADVEQLDLADLKASFTSTYAESGASLPPFVSPEFSVDVETAFENNETTTTTTVAAEGPGAADAVTQFKPAQVTSYVTKKNDFRRTASGTFVSKAIVTATGLVTHSYSISGGGRPMKWHPRTGARQPVKHLGSFTIVTIVESYTIDTLGAPTVDKFKVPPTIDGPTITEDVSRFKLLTPRKITQGTDQASDKWRVGIERVFYAFHFGEAAKACFDRMGQDSATRDAETEAIDSDWVKPDAGEGPNG